MLFQLNFASGNSYSEKQQAHGQLRDSMLILVTGLSYSRPEYSLGAESAFYPTLPPLVWPSYDVGPVKIGLFREISIATHEGQTVNSRNDLFAEINVNGSMEALLSCGLKDEALPSSSPLCRLHEQVEGWETTTTFLRDQFSQIDTIRARRDEFVACISQLEQK